MEEHLDVLCGILVQTVFHRDVVEERVALPANIVVAARGYLAANLHLQTVVHETLGELERVVGMHGATGIGGVVNTYAEVE